MNRQNKPKPPTKKILLNAAILLLLANLAQASTVSGRVTIINEPPKILSVKTYSSYTNMSHNTPETNFSAFNNKTVHVQINISDQNGAEQITNYGGVKLKIVFWNTTDETTFARFGANYADATLEETNGIYATYKYSYEMQASDPSRTGRETPPRYYRAKAEILDGEYLVPSNQSSDQNADYTYYSLPKVMLNEFQPSFGGPTGFIEIYNAEDYDVDLAGWMLADAYNTSSPYMLSGTIPAKGILVYYPLTTGIAFDSRGDNPRLLVPSGAVADNFTYQDGMTYNHRVYSRNTWDSFGRIPDGNETWTVFKHPSPGYSNPPENQREIPQQDEGGGGGGPTGIIPRIPKMLKMIIELPLGRVTTSTIPTQPKATTTTTAKRATTTTLRGGFTPETQTTTTTIPPEGQPPEIPALIVFLTPVILIALVLIILYARRKKRSDGTPEQKTKLFK